MAGCWSKSPGEAEIWVLFKRKIMFFRTSFFILATFKYCYVTNYQTYSIY